MKAVPLPKKRLFDTGPGLTITITNVRGQEETRDVGILNCLFVLEEHEVKSICKPAEVVSREIISHNPSFTGLIRLDGIPALKNRPSEPVETNWKGMKAYYLGDLYLRGFYELNAGSPECVNALSLLKKYAPYLYAMQSYKTEHFVKVIQQTYNNRLIYFLPGNEGDSVKKSWYSDFFQDLQSSGAKIIDLKGAEAAEILSSLGAESVIYRYGDDDPQNGASQFKPDIAQALRQTRAQVFNTLPQNGFNIADKGLLMPTGTNKLFDEYVGSNFHLETAFDIKKTLENKNSFVLKKRKSTGGKDVLFLCNFSEIDCEKLLIQKAKEGGWAVFEARWLPSAELLGEHITFDMNPAFWVRNGKLDKLLYLMFRADKTERYNQEKIINVTKGAGFAGDTVRPLP
jgi:hypothetical protein